MPVSIPDHVPRPASESGPLLRTEAVTGPLSEAAVPVNTGNKGSTAVRAGLNAASLQCARPSK